MSQRKPVRMIFEMARLVCTDLDDTYEGSVVASVMAVNRIAQRRANEQASADDQANADTDADESWIAQCQDQRRAECQADGDASATTIASSRGSIVCPSRHHMSLLPSYGDSCPSWLHRGIESIMCPS